ncbi:MAG: hypothetical protein ACM37W_00445 [Actinomycetota bacterium]
MKPQVLGATGFLIAVAIAYLWGMNATFEATLPGLSFLETGQPLSTGGLWLIAVFATLLCQTHVFSSPIRYWMRRGSDPKEQKYLHLEVIASSLGSGIAVAYVFLHLLPQLSHHHPDLRAINPYLILVGFLVFYGMERLALELAPSQPPEWELIKRTAIAKPFFSVEIAFLCAYNALIVYTMPAQLEYSLASSLVYMLAMILHLMRGDHSLRDKYPKQFKAWGRHALAATAILAALAGWLVPPNPIMSDLLIAALTGCTLLNVFKDELPDPVRSSYRWFLTGALVLGLLMFFIP